MQLPNEIVVTGVLSCLPVRDILSCSEVSWDFNGFCQDRYLWKQLYLRDYGIMTETGLRMLEEIGYRGLYKHCYILTVQMHAILGIRTEETPTTVFNEPTFVTYCILYTNADMNFVKVTRPVTLGFDFYTGDGVLGGNFTLYPDFNTYSAGRLREQFANKEISKQEVQKVIEDLVADGYYRTLDGTYEKTLEPIDNRIRELLDFGLMAIHGLEKLPSKKIRNLLNFGWGLLSYNHEDVEQMWEEELGAMLEQ